LLVFWNSCSTINLICDSVVQKTCSPDDVGDSGVGPHGGGGDLGQGEGGRWGFLELAAARSFPSRCWRGSREAASSEPFSDPPRGRFFFLGTGVVKFSFLKNPACLWWILPAILDVCHTWMLLALVPHRGQLASTLRYLMRAAKIHDNCS
jgi:hypothetical protein